MHSFMEKSIMHIFKIKGLSFVFTNELFLRNNQNLPPMQQYRYQAYNRLLPNKKAMPILIYCINDNIDNIDKEDNNKKNVLCGAHEKK